MSFRVFQSLWGMEGLPHSGGSEWSLDEKLARIVEAGFDGVEVAWAPFVPDGPEAIRRATDLGLGLTVVCFPSTIDDFKAVADHFAGSAVRHINIQPEVRPLTVAEGVVYVEGWLETARDAGLNVYLETHRGRMTQDLRYTLALLDAIPSMELVADLSHYVVSEELTLPVSGEHEASIRRVLARSSAFHGRVASPEQVQIPIGFAHHKPWLDVFVGWWTEGFRLWRGRAEVGWELVFVVELGPPMWYAITDASGNELSDRWQEALTLQQLVRDAWAAPEELEALQADPG
jgi:sugar phosphate isomerase/epimerase